MAIQGAIGIGKSSLLSRVRLLMEGFGSDRVCQTVIAVGTKAIRTIDEMARLLLERFVQVDETQQKIKLSLKSIFEFESSEVYRYFKEGRHLAVLSRIIEERHLPDSDLLILAVDEADKCPVPLAQLIRSITTHVQHNGIKNVRFVTAGVTPYFQAMVDEDAGISRFFYKTLTLPPMPEEEAEDLVSTKLVAVRKAAQEEGTNLEIDPSVIDRVVKLSGGHPHLLQLLGSHLIEHENQDPDGILDARDLVNSLRAICYEDRARAYDAIVHVLELRRNA